MDAEIQRGFGFEQLKEQQTAAALLRTEPRWNQKGRLLSCHTLCGSDCF